MKRVNAISKGKSSFISDLIDRKAKRIMRQVEQAIDYAADKVEELKDIAEAILNSFGDYAEASQTSSLQSRINAYTDKVAEVEEWEAQLERLKALKAKLEEEVKIDEENK